MAENEHDEPSPTESNGDPSADGRDTGGRFAAGNRFARGNPHARRVQQIRSAMLDICTPARMRTAAEKLMVMAENGDRFAFAELADRVLGKPIPADLTDLVEQVEQLLSEREREASR